MGVVKRCYSDGMFYAAFILVSAVSERKVNRRKQDVKHVFKAGLKLTRLNKLHTKSEKQRNVSASKLPSDSRGFCYYY